MYSKEEAKTIRIEFWEKLNNRTRRLPGQKGRKKFWILENTGIKGVALRFDIDRNKAQVALEINHSNEKHRLELYEKMNACKSVFEMEFGEPLVWDFEYKKDADVQVCRVFVERQGDIHRKELWPEMIYFLIDKMMKLEKAFLAVKDYMQSDMNRA